MSRIIISGYLEGEPEFSHEIKCEKFYKVNLVSERLSGTKDVVPCIISDIFARLLNKHEYVKFVGDIRTRNVFKDGKTKLEVYVFVNEVHEYDTEQNCVEFEGIICKKATYRKTPFGREISDVMLAVNRPYGKSDYIPCICWGRNAKKVANYEVGTQIKICGRFQSRDYFKTLDNGEIVTLTAFEVSVDKVESEE